MAGDNPESGNPDAWEESARIVEAIASTADSEAAELLDEAAEAIRDHATDD